MTKKKIHIFFPSRFTVDIYDAEREQFLIDLKNTRFISVLIDGATDSGIGENEIVYVKYLTKEKGKLDALFIYFRFLFKAFSLSSHITS